MLKPVNADTILSKYGKDKLGPVAYLPANAKTGTWRLHRPVPDNAKCSRCHICEKYCPCAVIVVAEEGCHIDYTYCKGCGICVEVCPKKIIQMIPENSQKEVL